MFRWLYLFIFLLSLEVHASNLVLGLQQYLQLQCRNEMSLNVTKKILVHFMEATRKGEDGCEGPTAKVLSENCLVPTVTCAQVLEYYRILDNRSHGNLIGL